MATSLPVKTRRDIVEQLIRVHGTALVRYLGCLLRGGSVAEEVAQAAYERLRILPLEDTPPETRKAVLFRVGSRLALARVRHRRRGGERDNATSEADYGHQELASFAASQRDAIARQQAFTGLTSVVAGLPERLREPWVLRYTDELPREVICARLGISASDLVRRLVEARALCEALMAHSGFEWSSLD